MFDLLRFYRGAVTLADYEAMPWSRRETARRVMEEIRRQQSEAMERARRG